MPDVINLSGDFLLQGQLQSLEHLPTFKLGVGYPLLHLLSILDFLAVEKVLDVFFVVGEVIDFLSEQILRNQAVIEILSVDEVLHIVGVVAEDVADLDTVD